MPTSLAIIKDMKQAFMINIAEIILPERWNLWSKIELHRLACGYV
jgi:hypothetical protein